MQHKFSEDMTNPSQLFTSERLLPPTPGELNDVCKHSEVGLGARVSVESVSLNSRVCTVRSDEFRTLLLCTLVLEMFVTIKGGFGGGNSGAIISYV